MPEEEEYLNVPLVIYVDGVRHVVGECTVKGSEVKGVVYPKTDEGEKIVAALSDPHACFSFGWTTYEMPEVGFQFKPAFRGEFPGPQQMHVKYINIDKPSGIRTDGEDVFKQEDL